MFLGPLTAQVPQGFNYQAIARDGSGNLIASQSLPARITIQSDSLGTSVIWQELHPEAVSNSFGLISLILGRGERETPSNVATFSDIDWSVVPMFIKTEIYYSSAWKTMGVSRLWSVPYATVADDLAGPVAKLSVEGEAAGLEEALFEVKNKDGQTIFAVYNEGVRIYVDDGAKGTKGGFAVGGFDMTKATKREYLVVSDDSIRMYLDNNPLTKAKKGGFAVGGFDMTKGSVQDYMNISQDSIRIYIDNSSTKALKGGFAVGGFDATKTGNKNYMNVTPDSTRIYTADAAKGFGVGSISTGVAQSYLKLTPENYFIGHQSGTRLTSGLYNSFFGYNAGLNNTTGDFNIFIGYQSGYTNRAGDYNTFLGYQSGYSNWGSKSGSIQFHGRQNCYFGYQAGFLSEGADACVMVGFQAGFANTKSFNTFIGYKAGSASTEGSFNTYMGALAGGYSTIGGANVFLGDKSGAYNISGGNNVYVGSQAGYMNDGTSNVIIGGNSNYQAFDNTGGRNVIIGAGAATYAKGNGNMSLIGCSVVEGVGTLEEMLFIENCGDAQIH